MTEIVISASYHAESATNVELPEGKTHEDIKHIWCKWGRGLIEFHDGSQVEFDEDDIEYDAKRPDHMQVWDSEWENCWIEEVDDTLRV